MDTYGLAGSDAGITAGPPIFTVLVTGGIGITRLSCMHQSAVILARLATSRS